MRSLAPRFFMLALPLLGSVPVSAKAFDAARAYAAATGGLCLLIEQKGKLLVEDYGAGCSPHTDHRIYSLTKSLWALAAFAMQRDGLLAFDERAADTLIEWRGSDRERITIRQLLSMTAGLPSGAAAIYGDDSSYAADALSQPLKFSPGNAFNYGAASMEAFGELIRRLLAAQRQSPENYLEKRILKPNGIKLRTMKRDRTGGLMYSSGIRATAPNLLRLGSAVLAHARDPEAGELFKGSDPNPSYGLTFWLNPFSGRPRAWEPDIEEALLRWPAGAREWTRVCLASSGPPDLIVLLGSRGQRLYILPSTRTIIVRLSNGGTFRDAEFWRRMPR